MKHLPSVLLALLLAGAVAACLASQNLYGQNVYGQGVPYRPDAVQVWREAAMRGLTYNESLALYRLRQSSPAPTPLHPRFQTGGGALDYRTTAPGPYRSTFTPGYPSTVYQRPMSKPFANVRQQPTAFERYWPLMIEGREDPKTGQIIWYFP